MNPLTCWSCDHWSGSVQDGTAPKKAVCKLHGLVEMRLLEDCADASYRPGVDERDDDADQ